MKAFRLMVNRSVTWADWDEELLALELQELKRRISISSLTGFDPGEIDGLLAIPDEETGQRRAAAARESGLAARRPVALRQASRALRRLHQCRSVARLLGDRKPQLMVTDPPYGIELDSEWRDRAGLNGCGPAEASYMKQRTEGHTETTISGDTRADWSEAFELVPEPRGRVRLARIEVHARSARRPAADRLPAPPADHLGQGPNGPHADALLVPARALLVRAKEERAVVRQGRRELDDLGLAIAEVHHGRLGRGESTITRRRSPSN